MDRPKPMLKEAAGMNYIMMMLITMMMIVTTISLQV